jgi:hypothetical protein
MSESEVESERGAVAASATEVDEAFSTAVEATASSTSVEATATSTSVVAQTRSFGTPFAAGSIVAVSDAGGFLGAFLSVPEANTKIIERYPLIPFLVQRYPLDGKAPLTHVWAVPYRDSTALAVVTNSRDEAERVRRALALVGLAYEDSVDYWKLPMGDVVESGAERLESQRRAHLMYADGAVDAELQRQAAAGAKVYQDMTNAQEEMAAKLAADGPIALMIRENARIGFIDCVVDVGYEDESDTEDTEETEGAPDCSVFEKNNTPPADP